MTENAIYSTIDLPPEPQYQNFVSRRQKGEQHRQKASPRFPFACHLAIALGLLSVVLLSLLLVRCQDSQRYTFASCPDLWMNYHNHCYYFSVEQMDWESSQRFCGAKNSSLLVLTDKQEMANSSLLKDFFKENSYWIGLRNNSGWKWEDGSPLNNLKVHSNSLVQTCGTIYGGAIQASSCEADLHCICEMAKRIERLSVL